MQILLFGYHKSPVILDLPFINPVHLTMLLRYTFSSTNCVMPQWAQVLIKTPSSSKREANQGQKAQQALCSQSVPQWARSNKYNYRKYIIYFLWLMQDHVSNPAHHCRSQHAFGGCTCNCVSFSIVCGLSLACGANFWFILCTLKKWHAETVEVDTKP